jgi:demethylmenaquinone methyltransferase/2-methoxy-6-polyprenyl-1,4-benzoquinol methylase
LATGDKYADDRFQRIAANYDRTNRIISAGLDRIWRRQAIALLHRRPGETTLDLCCGTGEITIALAHQRIPGRLIGLDISEAMLARASRKLIAEPNAVELVRGDTGAIPFADAAVDSIICGFGLRNLRDWPGGLREMRRVLRPGGRVVLLEFIPPPSGIRGWLARTWIERVVPLLGRLLTGDDEAYRFLARSVIGFVSLGALAGEMEQAGFISVEGRRLFPGVVAVWQGRV